MAQELLNAAIAVAREAGAVIRERCGADLRIEHKGAIDLVTEIDIECEKIITARLKSQFPSIEFLCEEGTVGRGTGDSYWIIDPVDGTTNLAHGYPHVAVSIGLKLRGILEAGVVYNPFLDELFHARKGAGAFLNGRPVRVSGARTLRDSLLATGFPYTIGESPELPLSLFCAVVPHIQGIRRDGAASLDLCYVASGRVDGFWEADLKPWDTAAATLLIREAGGMITDFEGSREDIVFPRVIATNGIIHEFLLGLIKKALRTGFTGPGSAMSR